jgi:coenzyme F420 hydrogenase subunit beta
MMEKKKNMGQNELSSLVLGSHLCSVCGACVGLCPYFSNYKGRVAIIFPCTLSQGRCFAYCPKIEVNLDDLSERIFRRPYSDSQIGYYQSVFMAQASERVKRQGVQAGGAVSALVSFALAKGYIDGAILTDRSGLLPLSRLVTTPDEVPKCATSKFTAAPTLSVLNQGSNYGYRKIGLVATPCQVLAVTKIRTNPLGDEAFIDHLGLVIGLFCTWALDFRFFEEFIAKKIEVNRIVKFDIPPPPANRMEVYLDDGKKIEMPLDEIRPFILNACSYCIDMTAEFSDVSVGLMEGRPDMNTLIIRTERGQEIVEKAQAEGYLVISEIPRENFEHLKFASGNKKKKALIMLKEKGLVNGTGGDTISCLKVRKEIFEKLIA